MKGKMSDTKKNNEGPVASTYLNSHNTQMEHTVCLENS